MMMAKTFIDASFPASNRIRPGSRTKRLRSVPREYSWAVCAAKTQRAIIPRRLPILEKACVEPLGSASISRVIWTPRSPLPCGESISKNRNDETKILKKATAPRVPSNRVGRRSLRHSAKNILERLRIISVLL